MLTTLLFDLDGTLLPMDQKAFISAYFRELAAAAAPWGYDRDQLIPALWKGTEAMVRNDGGASNCERFWQRFAEELGKDVRGDEPHFDNFYATSFDNARRVVEPRRSAKPALEELRRKGYALVLATNPLFPRVAVERRLVWAGLDADLFDHITDYANSRFCKPNPRYYADILETLGKDAAEALMIGNNVSDDMAAAEEVGIKTYLVPDYLENEREIDIAPIRQGNFEEMLRILRALPSLR